MSIVSCYINDVEVKAKREATILEAAWEAGIYIPALCTYPGLRNSVERCQLCIVEIDGGTIAASCTTTVSEGMVVKTDTEKIRDIRRSNLRAGLAILPVPRLVTDELKKIAEYIGVKEEEIPPFTPRNLPVDDDLMVRLDHNLCILCGRCTEVCKGVSGNQVIGFTVRGKKLSVGPTGGASSYEEAGCRFCGACVGSCPTQALTDKKAWPEDNVAPCVHACPAGIDVPRYVYLISEGRFDEALAVIREKVPFPGTLGRVCYHPCEDECRRSQLNEPISIAALKWAAADHDSGEWRQFSRRLPSTGKKVAIIGSGPAGLTAGYYLVKAGHSVTVFEQFSEAGGMMRVGIPDYRLPREVLDDEIEEIKRVGVNIKLNSRIEQYHSSVGEEAFSNTEVEELYWPRDFLVGWVR